MMEWKWGGIRNGCGLVGRRSCIGLCEADIAMSSYEGMHLRRGTVGEGEREMGRKGGFSIQPTRYQSGQGSHHNTEEGFQVSKRGVQGIRVGISKQKGIIKRIGACTSVYRANRVYVVLIKDCV